MQGVAERQDDCVTLSQFLQSHSRRRCTHPSCKEGVLRHEQAFYHRGARLSLRMQQLPSDHGLPSEGFFTWSFCQLCPPSQRTGPVIALSAATHNMPLARFLESYFYNTSACSRSCPHSLHRDQEGFISCGGMVATLKFERCNVYSMTPPIAPQALGEQLQRPPATRQFELFRSWKAPQPPQLSTDAGGASDVPSSECAGPSSVAAHALCSLPVVNEVLRITGGQHVALLTTHERLAEVMLDESSLSEVDIRYEGDLEKEAEKACPGLSVLRATVLFPAAFAAMRQRFCEGGDEAFVQSLRQSQKWDTGGGGRRGTFLKTLDGRYVLKRVKEGEFRDFLKHGREYFAYVSNTPTALPSLLVKVMGAFMVEFMDRASKKDEKQYLLVQENLFYGKSVSTVFDLKGANRDQNPNGETENDNATMLDENFFRFNNGDPLLLTEAAKRQLTRALWNDSLFLQVWDPIASRSVISLRDGIPFRS